MTVFRCLVIAVVCVNCHNFIIKKQTNSVSEKSHILEKNSYEIFNFFREIACALTMMVTKITYFNIKVKFYLHFI